MLHLSSSLTFLEANLQSDHQPGDEGTWFKDNMPHFMEQVHIHNNNDVREMLKEVSEREDMKNFVE